MTVSDLKSNFDMTGVSTVYEAAKCQMVGLGRKKVKEGKWKNGWKVYFSHIHKGLYLYSQTVNINKRRE